MNSRLWALIKRATERGAELHTTHPVLAQVWRDPTRQAHLARALSDFDVAVWDGLGAFDRPFRQSRSVRGPALLHPANLRCRGPTHDRLPVASHFIQGDQGAEIDRRMVTWWDALAGPWPLHDDGRIESATVGKKQWQT